MPFGDLRSPAGLTRLDGYLLSRSYIEGFQPSKADVEVFRTVGKPPNAQHVNVQRWYSHIASYGNEANKFPDHAEYPNIKVDASKEEGNKPADQKCDNDLFGSDSDDSETERLLQKHQAAIANMKKTKPAVVAKSAILLEVKPFDNETDMREVEKAVRAISTEGLIWGTSKLVPVAYGIMKLQINCVVEDDKVGVDFIEEEIEKLDDMIQSMDVASFQKL